MSIDNDMNHTYKVTGMSCNGCVAKVNKALVSLDKVVSVDTDLKTGLVDLKMSEHIALEELQNKFKAANLHYTISLPSTDSDVVDSLEHAPTMTGSGVFHCPMHCEGDKDYSASGDCPVCGMDLVEQPRLTFASDKYTCSMHPEIMNDEPGTCSICGMDLVADQPNSNNKAYRELLFKFKIALLFTLPIFILAMGEMIPGNPITSMASPKTFIIVQFLLSLPVVFYAGWMFFERAWRSVKTWNLNMFTLIGIGTSIAWVFSVVGILFPDLFPIEFKSEGGTVHVYFEAATVILTLVLLGQLLEARAHGQTNSAIKKLLQLAPNDAIQVDEFGNESKVSINRIKVGDILRVRPGDRIPVDGIITDGNSNIDESMITGEPIPVNKSLGDSVSSGTLNGNRSFLMKATKVGADTLLAQIIQMVQSASRSRAPIQRLADKISKVFVPVVLFISLITFFVWYWFGPDPALVFAFVNAIAVLIIACPCALGLATPMSVMVGIGKAAQNGILIKNAETLEQLNKLDVLITDKTGTITEGKPSVEKLVSIGRMSSTQLGEIIGSISKLSEHPLADSMVKYAEKQNFNISPITNFESISGKGVIGSTNQIKVAVGNAKLMHDQNVTIDKSIRADILAEQKEGKTVSYIAMSGILEGYICISDSIKKTSKQAIKALQKKGIKVVMLTGDNHATATAVAKDLELSDFKADCLPKDKLEYIQTLQSQGLIVAMAGDGINDAPALAQADVGIAMGKGTDIAIESSEITLVKGDLLGIHKAVKLSRSTIKNINQNLFFAFAYNSLGVPIAAGVLYPFFGLLLSPMLAAAAMSFSSFSVIANSLRLRKLAL